MPATQRYLLLFVFCFVLIGVSQADENTQMKDGSLTRDQIIANELQAAIDQARADGTEQTQENFKNIEQKIAAEIKENSGKDESGLKDESVAGNVLESQETTQKSFVAKQEAIDAAIPSPKFDQGPLEITEEAPNPDDVRSRVKKIELALQMESYNYQTKNNFPADWYSYYYDNGLPYNGRILKDGNEVEKAGLLYGVHASYTYRRPYKFPVHTISDLKKALGGSLLGLPSFLRLEGDLSYGQISYDSHATGKLTGYDTWQCNIRVLGGYDFLSQDSSFMVTPYLGVGYRRYSDKTGGWIDFDLPGYSPYENIFSYFYFPVGVETLKNLNENWDLGFKLEGSLVFGGTITQAHSDIDTIIHSTEYGTGNSIDIQMRDSDSNLRGGLGFKSSVQGIRKFEKYNIFAEPFFELWYLRKTKPEQAQSHGTNGKDYVTVNHTDGSPYNPIYEPENFTLELGVRLGVQF